MIMVLVYIILYILLFIFLSLALILFIGFTMSFYSKFHLIHVLLFFTVHYDCICFILHLYHVKFYIWQVTYLVWINRMQNKWNEMKENMNSQGRVKISSLLNRFLHEFLGLTPAISLIIFFHKMKIFFAVRWVTLKITPYFITEWKYAK
jgi:hypothetical protein